MHAHTMVSVWPNMNAGGKEPYRVFFKPVIFFMIMRLMMLFNEEAREMYWKQAQEGLFDQGFDSWWCDSTEPFSGPDWSGAAKREPWERFSSWLEASTRNIWILLWLTLLHWSMQREFMRTREKGSGEICVYLI